MAKTIPQLTDATTVNAADELIVQQGGITKRATGAELAKGLNTINGVVNVKDFGAVGDGVADDTAAFTSAFANSGQYPVLVGKGNWNSSQLPWQPVGAIAFSEGANKQVWLLTRKMTGNQTVGPGPLSGFTPTAYMQDLEEDCEVSGSEFMIASRVRHRFLGGASARGGRTAFISQLQKLGTTASDNANRNYVSSAAFITIADTDGGTDTLSNSTAKGGHFAGSWAAYVRPEATNLLNVCGGEINIFGESGASTRYQSGISIACAYAQRGAESDAALSISGISNAITHVGYGAGILFSSTNGQQPFSSTSTIILAKAGPSNPSGTPPTIYRGVDFSQYNITDALFKGALFELKENRMTLGADSNGFSVVSLAGATTDASYVFRTKGDGAFQVQSAAGANYLLVSPTTICNYGSSYTLNHDVATVQWTAGSGSPEGVVTANVGSIYSRTNGGAATSLYVKESGSGNTGWVAK